jgi:hypothetical protein
MDRRVAISEEAFEAKDSTFCFHEKPYKATCLGCKGHFQAQ